MKEQHENTSVIEVASTYQLTDEQKAEIRDASAVIVGTYTYNVSGRSPESAQMQMVKTLGEVTEAPVIALGIRNPYDVMAYNSEVDAYLAQYGFRTASFKATAATIFGTNTPGGKLPVSIPGVDEGTLYEFGHGLTY